MAPSLCLNEESVDHQGSTRSVCSGRSLEPNLFRSASVVSDSDAPTPLSGEISQLFRPLPAPNVLPLRLGGVLCRETLSWLYTLRRVGLAPAFGIATGAFYSLTAHNHIPIPCIGMPHSAKQHTLQRAPFGMKKSLIPLCWPALYSARWVMRYRALLAPGITTSSPSVSSCSPRKASAEC